MIYAALVYPSFFTNAESDPNQINVPNSQSSALAEIDEQCLLGNAFESFKNWCT